MVGALRLPTEEILADTAYWTLSSALGIGLAGVIGVAVVFALDRYTDELDYDV
jgi:hypothetical protein